MSGSDGQRWAADVTQVAVLGGGVIGQSWTALFLAAGKRVALFDPDPGVEDGVRRAVETAWPTLVALGLAEHGTPDAVTFHTSAQPAVEGARFIQESIPEVLQLKHRLYADLEPMIDGRAVVASSASGLTLTQMQTGWRDPARFVLGHPFNPPHLIPLVEVLGNDLTAPGVVERARAFYESVGKVTVEVLREVPGHVANRLQAALWREAIHLVNEGVATVADVDTAVAYGPGLRWAAMGPTLLFHLGAGPGGLASFCDRYAGSFEQWWDDLGSPHLDEATTRRLVDGVTAGANGRSIEELAAERDARIAAILLAGRSATDRS